MQTSDSSSAIFDPSSFESKWSSWWIEKKLYSPNLDEPTRPYYNLMMFPYPSAEGLHVGNMYAFTGADIFGRYKRMLGHDVFEPIGLDGFGIHSENYAIKIGKHPAEQALISQERFYEQLKMIGNGFSWDHRLETYSPEYYKWTQWLFVQMFKHGLAYKASSKVNWCPSCKTVLADEQVEDGYCERCKSQTKRKETEQWFFKITEYAEPLLAQLDNLNWPESIKTTQRNWIGKKHGAQVKFQIVGSATENLTCFTTRLDTLFGVTFLVISPEQARRMLSLVPSDQLEAVERYIEQALNKTEQQRKIDEKEKTGVSMGFSVTHEAFNESMKREIPVWVSDYVLEEYGTGVVMGVPAHDERDHAFAEKFNLPILPVIKSESGSKSEPVIRSEPGIESQNELVYTGKGVLIESGMYSGMQSDEAVSALLSAHPETITKNTQYHLRDWLISRQRYWGPPIPMVFCERCGWQPVPEDQLPVLLPQISEYLPTGDGKSPLARADRSWLETTCPSCGGVATRETDVSDAFLDSSWYFLRYLSLGSDDSATSNHASSPFDASRLKKWMPVGAYIGGAEHAVLHLLYSRFVTHALHDWGFVENPEPFPFLYGHGLIIKDGSKMSKSKGNVVNPDDYIRKYGADVLRTYLMFLGPYDQGGDFRDTGIAGISRWFYRLWKLFHTKVKFSSSEQSSESSSSPELEQEVYRVIEKNTRDMNQLKFNTSIASLMEVTNVWQKDGVMCSQEQALDILKMLAPFAPFLTEELYHTLFHAPESESIHTQPWPVADPAKMVKHEVSIAVQVNGKMRKMMTFPADLVEVEKDLLEEVKIQAEKMGLVKIDEIEKTYIVPGRLVNFVLKKKPEY